MGGLTAGEINILIKARDEASRVMGRIGTATGKLTNTLSKLRLPIIAAAAAFTALGVAAISAGSDLIESMNKVDVTFRNSAGAVEEFAETSAKSFGISKQSALEYSAVLGNIFQASGLAREESAKMAVAVTQLSADMASFNNIPIDVALEKLRAGLVGEAEPLRTVGVLISDAAVKTQAYKDGIADMGAELTEGQKVQARFALIMEQTANAQGDFTRTSGDAANAQRILGARLDDLRATIGVQLMPAWMAIIGFASETVIPFMEKWLPVAVDKAKAAFEEMRPTIEELIEGFKVGFETIEPVIERVFNFIVDNKPILVAAILAIGAAIVIAFGPVSIAIAAIVGLITAIGLIRDNWEMLKRETMRILGIIADFMQDVFNSAANAVIGTFEQMVNNIIELLNTLAGPFNTMIGLFNALTGQAIGKLELARVEFGRLSRDIARGTPGFRTPAVGAGTPGGPTPGEQGEQWGEDFGEGVADGLQDSSGSIADAMEEAIPSLLDILAQHESEIEQAWGIIIQTIERGTIRWQDVLALTELGEFGREVADDFVRAFHGESSRIGDAIFEAAEDAAREAAEEAAAAFAEEFEAGISQLEDALSGMVGTLTDIAGGPSVESVNEALKIAVRRLWIAELEAEALAAQQARLEAIAELEADIANERERSQGIIDALNTAIKQEQANLADFLDDANDRLVDAEERLASAREQAAEDMLAAEENLRRVREAGTEAIREMERELSELRRHLDVSQEIEAGGPRTLTDIAKDLEQARQASNRARATAFQAELDIAQKAAEERVAVLEEGISAEEAAIQAAEDQVAAVEDVTVAIEEEIQAIKDEIAARKELSKGMLDALRTDIEYIEELRDAEIERLEAERDAIAATRSEAELRIAVLEDEIAAIQAVSEARQLERDIVVLQAQLLEGSLPTEAQVLRNLVEQVQLWGELNDVFDRMADGIFTATDAMTLMQAGLVDLARLILEIVAGITPVPNIPTFQHGGIVPGPIGTPSLAMVHGGERIMPVGERAAPGPSTTIVHNHIRQINVTGDLAETLRGLGR